MIFCTKSIKVDIASDFLALVSFSYFCLFFIILYLQIIAIKIKNNDIMPVQTDCLHAIIKNVIIPIIKLIIEFIINHIISKNPFETSNIKFCIYPVCTSDNFFELIFSILEK